MEKESSMDRRSFLTGAVGVGAAVAAGSLAATQLASADEAADGEESSADEAADSDEASEEETDSGSDASDEQAAFEAAAEPIDPVTPPETYDYEADVVIVGSGAGGVMAAMRLADAGLSVALVEKASVIGGESRYAMYIINPGGNQIAESYEYAMPSYPYDLESLLSWLQVDEYQYTADPDLLRAIYTAGPDAIDWLIDEGGCNLDALYRSASGCSMLYWDQDCDSGEDPIEKVGWGDWFTNLQDEVLPEKGVEMYLSTEATALVQDENGRIVGIKAEADGAELYFHANVAVLLTAGDFSNNRALWKKYCPRSLETVGSLPGWGENTGEALRMCLGVGADIAGYDTIGMSDCDIKWGEQDEYSLELPTHLISEGQTVANQPWMRVNNRGERVPYGGVQPAVYVANPKTYAIFDEKWRELIPENYFGTRGPYYCTNRSENFQTLIDNGYVQTADTIEELEEKLGLNEGILSENVAQWNEACETGEDWMEYTPYDSSYLVSIDEPPYYGVALGGTVWAVKCGVRVNSSMQVLSTDGSVIPGLYAGFHTAGGQAGEMTLSSMSVTAYGQLGMSFVGGYMAADAIAEESAQA